MRTTIRLDHQLLEKTKQYALTKGTTFSAVVEYALREKLMAGSVSNKNKKVKLKTVSGQGVNRGVDLDDSAAMLDMMER